MPTNHRGQDIGAHNHANVVNVIRETMRGDGTHTLYSSPTDSATTYTSFVEPDIEAGPDDTERPVYRARALAKTDGRIHSDATEGTYNTEKRAKIAAHAMVNRHARTGDFGETQADIRRRGADRRYEEEERKAGEAYGW